MQEHSLHYAEQDGVSGNQPEYLPLTDLEAKSKICRFISQFKAVGKRHVDMIDLINLHILPAQIERVMKQLEKEKMVKADE